MNNKSNTGDRNAGDGNKCYSELNEAYIASWAKASKEGHIQLPIIGAELFGKKYKLIEGEK